MTDVNPNLSPQQEKMLKFLRTACLATRYELRDAMGLSHEKTKICVDSLISIGLVLRSQVNRTKKLMFEIAPDNSLALRRIPASASDDCQPTRAASKTTNLFEFPVYQPPKACYMRNDGHRNIQSKGF